MHSRPSDRVTVVFRLVAKVLWTLCYASSEEIPELQRPRRATGNHRNLQCRDDSIMQHGTWGRLAWVQWGPRSGGSALLVVGFSVLVSILLCSLSMSGAALSTRLRGALRFMTWRAQGVMNGWLLVFLYRMCCHKTSCAVVRLVAFQGVRRKPCMLPPVGGNF